jgi:flagellar basal-body rod protein FlgB
MLDRVSSSLERYLDLLSARQKVVSSNIANGDTPGYKTKDVDFRALYSAEASGEMPAPVEVSGLKTRNDGNNVSLDREARLLAENALRFNVASNLLRSQIRMVKSAIQEGRSA